MGEEVRGRCGASRHPAALASGWPPSACRRQRASAWSSSRCSIARAAPWLTGIVWLHRGLSLLWVRAKFSQRRVALDGQLLGHRHCDPCRGAAPRGRSANLRGRPAARRAGGRRPRPSWARGATEPRGRSDRGAVGDGGRGDVEPAAVDLDVAVDDELAGLAAGRGEPEAKDDVVNRRSSICSSASPAVVSRLHQAGRICSRGWAGDFQLLGLAQLQAVDAGGAAAAGAVLPGRGGAAALKHGLAAQLPLALEVERDSLPRSSFSTGPVYRPIRAP